MKINSFLTLAAALLLAVSCGETVCSQNEYLLASPDGKLELLFGLTPGGQPQYELLRDGRDVILPSAMGFDLTDGTSLKDRFAVTEVVKDSLDAVWNPVWGEEAEIRNHYNEALVCLRDSLGRAMNIRFRLYDDGLGFRYEFPLENALTYFNIQEELTQFTMTGDHTAWWVPGDYDSQEYNFKECRLSEISRYCEAMRIPNASQEGFSPWGVQTALQMKTDQGLYVNIHEAAVLDYPAANLLYDPVQMRFAIHLTPDAEGVKGRLQAPCKTPWRTVMVCPSATDVLASRLILNLNEPCALEDVSWIHPVKYMGVWWEMITGRSQWSYTDEYPSVQLGVTDYAASKPHGKHGANNENVRRYIDYAAENGFDAVLVEGWNEGWEDWFGKKKDFVFDFVTPYPDFDLPALNAYAHQKGVRLVMHHETSSSTLNYERWMEQAYTLMNQYGYDAVKSGYVGFIIPYGERHNSQPTINHYHYAITEAAKHHIMVNAHEAVRPTGLCRTWPNMIGNESAMGTEFRAAIEPGHTAVLPFTRLQGGPMDYTPGIFETDMSVTAPGQSGKMRHTLCNQLGLYVTFYSPLQMAADLPENYDRFPDAFQFIKDVAVDWDKSVYLAAEPGRFIVTARHPKLSTLNAAAESLARLPDGKKDVVSGAARFVYALPDGVNSLKGASPRDVWYVGGVGGPEEQTVTFSLGFLQPGMKYEATVYADGADADYESAPQSYTITREEVDASKEYTLRIARGGGFAISLREIR